jgi:hypothetical protein
LEKVFGKIASPATSCIVERERERNEREAAISYFFPASSNLYLCERREKQLHP